MLIQADARQIPLADGCVQCVVTSPPYFGLRDYGTANQIGLEVASYDFVAALVAVFREVRRVLANDGVCWLNIGDSYARNPSKGGSGTPTDKNNRGECFPDRSKLDRGVVATLPHGRVGVDTGASRTPAQPMAPVEAPKDKDLIGIPWRVAFALQADGWYLRSDIIWHKPNPMPESVTDRPTKAHEYLFLLTKSERYFYDASAVAEDGVDPGRVRADRFGGASWAERQQHSEGGVSTGTVKRNKRSVWTVNTMPYAGAHFATMPEKLVEPCILAGSRLGDRVLDPFMGSGTVGAVAERLGRRWVGLDLNPAYHQLAKKRTAQRGLMFGS